MPSSSHQWVLSCHRHDDGDDRTAQLLDHYEGLIPPSPEFENFKAHFEKTIQWSSRSSELAHKVDTDWSDLLWHVRGDDDIIDDEFLRYTEFITEICEWSDGHTNGAGQRIGPRTWTIFGGDSPRREEHLEFLFQAFDVWADRSIPETFESVFAGTDDAREDGSKVRLFFRPDSPQQPAMNLFEACCSSYGATRGRARVFSRLGQALVLYAVVLHLIEDTEEFPRRIRIVRNLIEASSDELRPALMPKILKDVRCVIRDGDVGTVATLNQAQVADEKVKASFLTEHPELQAALFRLEDHELLRGSLGAFELEAATFESRSSVFQRLMAQPDSWSELLGALLAAGEYQRRRTNGRPFLFGTDSKEHDSAWRDLLTGTTRASLLLTRETLASFLDQVAADSTPLVDAMATISVEYLKRCEADRRFDWRYYMVKYPAMREKGASTYFDSEPTAMGYSLCMLRAGGRALNGYYRDPYLMAMSQELADGGVVEDKWFTGHAEQPRRLPTRT